MKNKFLLGLFLFVLLGCHNYENNESKARRGHYLYGTWQLTQAYIVSGVDLDLKDISDGYILEISPDGTFSSTRSSEYHTGNVKYDSTQITFTYDDGKYDGGWKPPSYDYYFLSDHKLKLIPNFLTCDEGCPSEIFTKIAEPK